MIKRCLIAFVAGALLAAFAPICAKADSGTDTVVPVSSPQESHSFAASGLQTTGPGDVTRQAPVSSTPATFVDSPGLPPAFNFTNFTITTGLATHGADPDSTATHFGTHDPIHMSEPSGLLQTGTGLLAGLALIIIWRKRVANSTVS